MRIRGSLFALAACLTLAACSVPAKNFDAGQDLVTAVRSETPPQGEKARVLFFPGEAYSFVTSTSLKVPADFLVDGETAGSINKGEMLVVEVDPGSHQFSWSERSDGDSASRVMPLQRSVKPGEILYLKANLNMRYGGAFGGIVGLMIDPPRDELAVCETDCSEKTKSLKLVVPDASTTSAAQM